MLLSTPAEEIVSMVMEAQHPHVELDLRTMAYMTAVEARATATLCGALAARGLPRPLLIAGVECRAVLHIFQALSGFAAPRPVPTRSQAKGAGKLASSARPTLEAY